MNAIKHLFVSILLILFCGCVSSRNQKTNPDSLASNNSYVCRGILVVKSNDIELVETSLPPEMIEGYNLFKDHCVKCHPQERAIGFIKDCRFDNNQNYLSNIKVTVMKKIRMSGGEISKSEGKKIYEFLTALIELGNNKANH
jgi:hypothetical protein